MSDSPFSFSSDFPAADESQWTELVQKALKGGSPEKLNSKSYDGLTIQALYRDTDISTASDSDGFPGDFPFVRGVAPTKDPYLPWDIRQIISHPSPARANEDLIKDLENGVSSIELRIDEDGERGVCARTLGELKSVLDGVKLDLAPVGLDTTGASTSHAIAGAAQLAALASDAGAFESELAFNIDPIGVLARTGELPGGRTDLLSDTVKFTIDARKEFANASFLRVDARPIHEAGGSEAQELGFLMACGSYYMRLLMDGGLSANEASQSLLFTVSIGADQVLEIPKIRAARRLWAEVAKAFGCDDAACAMRLQAISSRRMLTARDPWVNMLRNAAASFNAGVGGADIVTIRPFTDALGLPSSLGRRIARNTQILAQEEASLGKVADPAGGAWSFSKLAEDLAQSGWSMFQDIEKSGGALESLKSGDIQAAVGEVRIARTRDYAHRKKQMTGVSDFPLLDQTEVDVETVDLDAVLSNAATSTGLTPADQTYAALKAGAAGGATLCELTGASDEPVAEADALWPVRFARPYELLRDHSDTYASRKGKRPTVFLAALGPLAEHSARLTFAQNYFAAGGVQAHVAIGSPEELGQQLEARDDVLVCICGSDNRYEQEASDAARALGAAGAGRLYLAGKPGQHEAAWREAGVDEFIHVGVNVVASLELAHSELGLTL